MKFQEFKKIIEQENLSNHNIFSQHDPKENEVGIDKQNNTWRVYTRNERATEEGIRFFDNESEALNNFVKRLRAGKV